MADFSVKVTPSMRSVIVFSVLVISVPSMLKLAFEAATVSMLLFTLV